MIRFLQISLLMLISILLGTLTAFACHEGDFTALSKGHYKWGKSAGLLQYTENITISSSTSTSCDMYTAYLWQQYDSIQEQVAQGQGEHLEAIAKFSGCTEPVTDIFKGELAQNYQSLFQPPTTSSKKTFWRIKSPKKQSRLATSGVTNQPKAILPAVPQLTSRPPRNKPTPKIAPRIA